MSKHCFCKPDACKEQGCHRIGIEMLDGFCHVHSPEVTYTLRQFRNAMAVLDDLTVRLDMITDKNEYAKARQQLAEARARAEVFRDGVCDLLLDISGAVDETDPALTEYVW